MATGVPGYQKTLPPSILADAVRLGLDCFPPPLASIAPLVVVISHNKTALQSDLGVQLAPSIGEGMRVRIKGGPLQGVEGWVEKRYGMTTVLLRLGFYQPRRPRICWS